MRQARTTMYVSMGRALPEARAARPHQPVPGPAGWAGVAWTDTLSCPGGWPERPPLAEVGFEGKGKKIQGSRAMRPQQPRRGGLEGAGQGSSVPHV